MAATNHVSESNRIFSSVTPTTNPNTMQMSAAIVPKLNVYTSLQNT